jgi:two-component system response regulator (stage 0 sporulation protein A)
LKLFAKCRKIWYDSSVNAEKRLFNDNFSCFIGYNRLLSTVFDLPQAAKLSERKTAMHTILLCDDNANSLEVLNLAFAKEPQFAVVAQAYDGKTALSLIEQHRPDIIILDVVMPEYDGVYIVNYIRSDMKEYDPLIYILSGLGTDPVIRTLNELGVDYYSMKPVPLSVIVQNLKTLLNQRGPCAFSPDPSEGSGKPAGGLMQKTLDDAIKTILLRFGLLPHRTSTKCVLDALVYYINSHEPNPLLTKVLYPQIAARHGLNHSSVEKNIRNAISQMQMNNTDAFNEIFSYSTRGRITNGEFLSIMSDYLKKHMEGSVAFANGDSK